MKRCPKCSSPLVITIEIHTPEVMVTSWQCSKFDNHNGTRRYVRAD